MESPLIGHVTNSEGWHHVSAANNCVLCSQHHVQRKLLPVRCTSYCRSAVTNSLSMLRFVPISHTLQHSLIGRLFLVWKIFLAQESGIANMNVRATVCMYVCMYVNIMSFCSRTEISAIVMHWWMFTQWRGVWGGGWVRGPAVRRRPRTDYVSYVLSFSPVQFFVDCSN